MEQQIQRANNRGGGVRKKAETAFFPGPRPLSYRFLVWPLFSFRASLSIILQIRNEMKTRAAYSSSGQIKYSDLYAVR